MPLMIKMKRQKIELEYGCHEEINSHFIIDLGKKAIP
jgi:hypothetical protein